MPSKKVKLGVLLQSRLLVIGEEDPTDADLMFSMAQKVEEAGLDSVWVGDSLLYNPRPEALTVLAAVAARTHRIRLGTAALVAGLRHPVWLADVVGTVDLISKGRLVLGIAAGGNMTVAQRGEWRAEWQAAGVNHTRRGGLLEELVEIVRRLGSGETLSFQGQHFTLNSVRMLPRPVQRGGVPMLFISDSAARRDMHLRRAARLGDGILIGTASPEELERIAEKLRLYVAEEGRNFDDMEVVTSLCVNLDSDPQKAAEEADRYLMAYYRQNFWGDVWGPFGPPEKTVEAIRAHVERGVADTIIVRLASYDQEGQLDTFLTEVWPAFR